MAGRDIRIKKQFLEDLEETRMRETIGKLNRALLVLHSPLDNIVGVDNAAHIFENARHPKSFVSLDRADHLLSDTRDSKYAGLIIAARAGLGLLRASCAFRYWVPYALDRQPLSIHWV